MKKSKPNTYNSIFSSLITKGVKTLAIVLVVVFLCLSDSFHAQSPLPLFLEGTWKMEGKENYEQWSILNANHLKGFSYKKNAKEIVVTEYLDISSMGGEVFYTAHVLNQNEGIGIEFKQILSGKECVFENPEHDFPQKIVYKKLNDNEVQVMVLGSNGQGFSYKLTKSLQPLGDN